MIKDRETRLQKQREWYQKNKEHQKRKVAWQKKINLQKKRDLIREYKETHGCKRCEERDSVCLDFHHKDDNKESTVCDLVRRSASFERILNEIHKCDVLCRNCHAKTHAGRFDEEVRRD